MMMKPLQSAVHPTQRLIAAALVLSLFAPSAALLAEPAPLPTGRASAPEPQLTIDILDGEGALNNIRQRTAREPIIEVKDENHKPVAGALVLFTVHPGDGSITSLHGASATFNGVQSISMYTDANGRAVGHGLTPNHTPGTYTIVVTATVGVLIATAIIHQRNVPGPWPPQPNGQPGHPPTIFKAPWFRWVVVGAVIAVITVVIVVLTRGKATTISAGTGTVGVP